MIVSGVSLCAIGGSIVQFRSGEDTVQGPAVHTSISAQPLSSVPSADVLQGGQSGVDEQQVSVLKAADGAGLARTSHRTTPVIKRESSARPHSVKHEHESSSAAFRNEEQSERLVPVSPETEPRFSTASEAIFSEPSAVPDTVFHGYSPVSVSRGPIVVKVDPSAPGNSLTSNGQRLMVDAYASTAEGSELELDVVIEPDASSTVLEHSEGEVPNEREARRGMVATGGLTYEEELFRTKWGWAAFNKIQQAARGSHSDGGR